jgi:hypothetical protein
MRQNQDSERNKIKNSIYLIVHISKQYRIQPNIKKVYFIEIGDEVRF